jgi:hypothetical protein
VDEATWAALAAALTVAGLIWTWVAFRRRGATNGLRALGFTMLVPAAWLTGTLEMLTEIAGSVTDWATGLVFNVMTWTGVGLAGLGVLLIFVSGILRDRAIARGQQAGAVGGRAPRGEVGPATGQQPVVGRGKADQRRAQDAPVDDEMAEIEALLRKRGIS